MGGFIFKSIYETEDLQVWRVEFEALGLREPEVGKLLNVFKQIDRDSSGSVALTELLSFVGWNETPFALRIFCMFDQDNSGVIDFREFVVSLWNYCTLSNANLDIFAFDLYDTDSSGELSIEEVDKMIREVYGSEIHKNPRLVGVLKTLRDNNWTSVVDLEKFRGFARQNQGILFPAFLLQQKIQNAILGRRFWGKISKRRIKLTNGVYVPVAKLMELHGNKDLYDEVVNKPKLKPGLIPKDANYNAGGIDENALYLLESTGIKKTRTDMYNEEVFDLERRQMESRQTSKKKKDSQNKYEKVSMNYFLSPRRNNEATHNLQNSENLYRNSILAANNKTSLVADESAKNGVEAHVKYVRKLLDNVSEIGDDVELEEFHGKKRKESKVHVFTGNTERSRSPTRKHSFHAGNLSPRGPDRSRSPPRKLNPKKTDFYPDSNPNSRPNSGKSETSGLGKKVKRHPKQNKMHINPHPSNLNPNNASEFRQNRKYSDINKIYPLTQNSNSHTPMHTQVPIHS